MNNHAKEPVPQVRQLPEILEQTRMTEGVFLEVIRTPRGIVDVPEQENVAVGIQVDLSAKLTCQRDGKRFTGTAVHGDIDIIPAQMPMHWEIHDENDHALVLNLPRKMLSLIAEELGLDPVRAQISNRFQVRDPELEVIFWAIKREMETGYPSGRFYLDGLAIAVASRLLARHSSVSGLVKDRKDGLAGRRLKQVLSFIEDQLAESLSLEQIAAVAGISTSHLNTLFRRSMGIPLYRYIVQRRVERAKALLTKDELSMAEVALAAGFAHQSHMARHMRRMLGLSPLEMKRQLVGSFTSR